MPSDIPEPRRRRHTAQARLASAPLPARMEKSVSFVRGLVRGGNSAGNHCCRVVPALREHHTGRRACVWDGASAGCRAARTRRRPCTWRQRRALGGRRTPAGRLLPWTGAELAEAHARGPSRAAPRRRPRSRCACRCSSRGVRARRIQTTSRASSRRRAHWAWRSGASTWATGASGRGPLAASGPTRTRKTSSAFNTGQVLRAHAGFTRPNACCPRARIAWPLFAAPRVASDGSDGVCVAQARSLPTGPRLRGKT